MKKTSLLFDFSFKRLSKDLTKTRVEKKCKKKNGTKFRSGGFKNRSQINILRHSLFISINVVIRNNFSTDYLPKYLPKGMIYPPITAGESTANRSPLRYLVTELFDTAIRPRYISRPRPIINKDLGTCSCRVALSR